MVRLNQWPISGRQIACLSVQVGRMQPHYPSVTTDPEAVIQSVRGSPRKRTLVQVPSIQAPHVLRLTFPPESPLSNCCGPNRRGSKRAMFLSPLKCSTNERGA